MQDNFDNLNGISGEDTAPFIPFETAWASIKPELDKEEERRKKKKRRFIIFWFLFAGVLLGSGIFLLHSNSANNTSTAAIKNVAGKEVTTKTIKNAEEKTTVNTSANNNTIVDEAPVSKEKAAAKNDKPSADTENYTASKSNTVSTKNDAQTKVIINKGAVVKDNYTIKQKGTVSINKSAVIKKDKKKVIKPIEDNNFTDSAALKLVAYLNPTKTKTYNDDNVEGTNQSAAKQITTNNNTITVKSAADDVIPVIVETNTTTASKDELKTIVKTNTPVDTTKKKVDSVNKKNATVKADNKPEKPAKEKLFSYGLQLNIPITDGANYKDVNADNKPLTAFIPEVWVSKLFGKKNSVSLHVNPYAQYYLNNKVILDSNSYSVTINQGTKINTGPEVIKYSEFTAVNKIISFEATLLYQYQVTNAIKLGVGISNCWTQGVLMQHRVIKNHSITTTDNLYGVDNSSTEWKTMNASFMLGKLEALYQYKKYAAGLNVSTPIKDLFAQKVNNVTATNTNLFLRWTIR